MFQIELDDQGFLKELAKYTLANGDTRPALVAIGQEITSFTKGRFDAQADPWGRAWKGLSDATKKRRGADAQILRDTGALMNSIHAEYPTADTVVVGTDRVYGAIHQFGGTIHRPPFSSWVRLRKNKAGRTVFAKNKHKRVTTKRFTSQGWDIIMPARPYLPADSGGVNLPDPLKQSILAALARVMNRGS